MRLIIPFALFALASAACGDDDAPTRPAGTVLHEVSRFGHGDNAFEFEDEAVPKTAEVALGPVDGHTVRFGIEMTAGVATVTYASDGSRARRRVPRAVTVKLLDETSVPATASCEPEWNGPLADPPATLFVSCRLALGEVGTGAAATVLIFGDGQVRAADSTEEAVAVSGVEPLPPLPGDPPGTSTQYVVAEPGGGFRLADEAPTGDVEALALQAPEVWRTELRIAVRQGEVSLVVRQRGGPGNAQITEEPAREVEASGRLGEDALAPLLEGHDAWTPPVAAVLELPPETPHTDVIAMIDALKARGVERFGIDMQ